MDVSEVSLSRGLSVFQIEYIRQDAEFFLRFGALFDDLPYRAWESPNTESATCEPKPNVTLAILF